MQGLGPLSGLGVLFACKTELLADPSGGRPISGEPRDLTSGSEAVIGADGYKAFICRTRASISVFLFRCCVCIENTWTADVARRLSEVSGGLAGFAFLSQEVAGRTNQPLSVVRECGEAHGKSLGLWRAVSGDIAWPQKGNKSPWSCVIQADSLQDAPRPITFNGASRRALVKYPLQDWYRVRVVSLIPFILGHSVTHVVVTTLSRDRIGACCFAGLS